jgi:outer membrane usher protein FimD/PapC
VEFAMLRERPALLVLDLPDGQPVAAGAIVTVLATGETATVGVRGEVYLQDLPAHAEIEVALTGGRCRIAVSRAASADPQPRLGHFACALHATP